MSNNKSATDSDSDDDSVVAFATMDFSGVNFDDNDNNDEEITKTTKDEEIVDSSHPIRQLEHAIVFDQELPSSILEGGDVSAKTLAWSKLIHNGQYVQLLRQAHLPVPDCDSGNAISDQLTAWMKDVNNVENAFQYEMIGAAALNIFLQLNYTGPSLLDEQARSSGDEKDDVDYTDMMYPWSPAGEAEPSKEMQQRFHNKVLSELAVDGYWPCQVSQWPYYLLVARTILMRLSSCPTNDQVDLWKTSVDETAQTTNAVVYACTTSHACHVWSLRAAVCHARLLLLDETSPTLWAEVKSGFKHVLMHYCSTVDEATSTRQERQEAAALVLEWGLCHHHLERPGKGMLYFQKALGYSGLKVEVTGALGKRTKYQQSATAQYQINATSLEAEDEKKEANADPTTSSLAIKHSEEEILLESVEYEGEKSAPKKTITILDQCILMALCLDVKNTNPSQDGLTAEEMGAYLARVLGDCQDWMVYATALLERAWLEFHSSHSKERSILQLQALMDQHSNRLTLTQSTLKAAVEDSAPAQVRLRHLHKIVYPPRWHMLRDLAERYARMGIVTSAAELFTEIELWDSVVDCYKRAGKEKLAKEIVMERLGKEETPRMWAALGDLTKDVQHYHKAIELSKGRFSSAYVSLGKHAFDAGDLSDAAKYYKKAVTLRPLAPHVWFKLGTIAMQLRDWQTALESFSKVVLQEPEEADAWANVAAVHMHEKRPEEAYPALRESLRYNRNNWRVWVSQLYTCIDLSKTDEAIQACQVLLDLHHKNSSDVPDVEEKCVRAIVGKALALDRSQDGTKRTLGRVHKLLDRMAGAASSEKAWIWETMATFHESVGMDDRVLENLLKEYRAMQMVDGWEKDIYEVEKVTAVVTQISHYYLTFSKTKEDAIKCRYLVKGVISKIKAAYFDESKLPAKCMEKLDSLLQQATKAMKNAND